MQARGPICRPRVLVPGKKAVPTIPEALNIAQQAAEAGDCAQAQFIYEQILKAAPDEPHALHALSVLARQAGQLEQAEGYLRRGMAAFPAEKVFTHSLYQLLSVQKRWNEAADCCRRAIEAGGATAELCNNLGTVLKAAGQLEPAVASFRDAIRLRPDYADAYYNLANTLLMLHQADDAERMFARAAELNPTDCDIQNNWGGLLRLQGRLAEAAKCFEAALAARPDSAEAHRNRATLRLLMGDYEQGFAEYEWRWKLNDGPRPNFSEPRWQGEPLDGRTILLWAEQGLGDTIQFIRYATLVKQRGARVLVECPPVLHALLQTVEGIDRFVVASGARFDYQIPLLSLPAVMGTTLETVPANIPYLHAEPERVARWKNELAGFDAFKVGITWHGSPQYPGDYFRSFPLAQLAPVAACPRVQLFSLQKNTGCEQLASWAGPGEIIDLGSSLDVVGDAFLDTAAVMMNLDLVITCDTAIGHLAGALGVPVWHALQPAPNWRWVMGRDDSPWYPTVRLFRQSRLGEWEEVFAKIAERVRSLSTGSRLE